MCPDGASLSPIIRKQCGFYPLDTQHDFGSLAESNCDPPASEVTVMLRDWSSEAAKRSHAHVITIEYKGCAC